jgi:copper resistance protein B
MYIRYKLPKIILLVMVSVVMHPDLVVAHGEDDPLLTRVMLDQLEIRDAAGDELIVWQGEGWLGKDLNKIWIKTDGERTSDSRDRAELQFLYSRAIARFWDFQIGLRHDPDPSPSRSWAAIGLKGLAPYFFETDAALFIGESGRTALRLEGKYEMLLTQRLILLPEIEINLYGQNDPGTGVGSGLSDFEAGLRLRYEFRREFAPYIGLNWLRLFGNSADFARGVGKSTSEAQFMIGIRVWF